MVLRWAPLKMKLYKVIAVKIVWKVKFSKRTYIWLNLPKHTCSYCNQQISRIHLPPLPCGSLTSAAFCGSPACSLLWQYSWDCLWPGDTHQKLSMSFKHHQSTYLVLKITFAQQKRPISPHPMGVCFAKFAQIIVKLGNKLVLKSNIYKITII